MRPKQAWLAFGTLAIAACATSPPAPAPTSPLAGVSVPLVPMTQFGDGERTQLFFAVLEGCYRDGVPNEVVDQLLEPDPKTGWPSNFVWACPICMPVIQALDAYRARPLFRGLKIQRDTFGEGLPTDVTAALFSADGPTRQATMQALLERWIGDYLASRRLTETELAHWRAAMDEGRQQGMRCLESYRQLGGTWAWMKKCPSCEAGNGAGGGR